MKILIATAFFIFLALAGFSQPNLKEVVIANRQKLYGSKEVITYGTAGVIADTVKSKTGEQKNFTVDISAAAKGGQGDGSQMYLVSNIGGTVFLSEARRVPHPWHTTGLLAKAHYAVTAIGDKLVIAVYGINGAVKWKITCK